MREDMKMTVKNILPVLDRDIVGDDYVIFYNCGQKIGYFNECELVSNNGICKLLDAEIEMISPGKSGHTLKIHVLFGDE